MGEIVKSAFQPHIIESDEREKAVELYLPDKGDSFLSNRLEIVRKAIARADAIGFALNDSHIGVEIMATGFLRGLQEGIKAMHDGKQLPTTVFVNRAHDGIYNGFPDTTVIEVDSRIPQEFDLLLPIDDMDAPEDSQLLVIFDLTYHTRRNEGDLKPEEASASVFSAGPNKKVLVVHDLLGQFLWKFRASQYPTGDRYERAAENFLGLSPESIDSGESATFSTNS